MKPKRPTWIPVVTGLIRRGDQYLVGLRPTGQSMPGVWEFPGGKIEPGEFPEKALERELQEELGIEAQIGNLLFVSSHQYGPTNILLIFYEIQYWRGEPKTIQHEELKWATLDQLVELNLPDANKAVIPKIKKLISENG